MKKLFLVLPLLWACKAKQAGCNAYSIYRIPYNDSLIVSQWHEHVHFDDEPHCIFVPKEITYFTDTIELKIPIEVHYYKSNKKVEPVNYPISKNDSN